MHSPTLVIGILVWFALPEVNAQLIDLTDAEKLKIEYIYNRERVDVSPNAADMLEVVRVIIN